MENKLTHEDVQKYSDFLAKEFTLIEGSEMVTNEQALGEFLK